MPHTHLISVVVTTYNRSDALHCVLTALDAQTDKNFEVVVADDGSDEGHVASIQSSPHTWRFPLVHVWHPDVGFTASKVRNLGVAQARGDYLVFLDGDCVPDVDFVHRHRTLSQPGCFVNGSRVLLSEPFTRRVTQGKVVLAPRPWWVWWGWRLAGNCSKVAGTFRLPDFALRLQRQFRWKGIRSCNMAVWKKDYIAVNGFDETFVGWGHEDADFVLRLHNAGLVRKDGFFATEVYHLWHREANRDLENCNAQRVRERMATQQVDATVGYRETLGFANARVFRK
ncbi:MAG: glycosyltransferase family 2 protein [Rhodoferax sp.]|nr:glycosyltransferase family 2 protein [Rhodoferax sp.]